MALPTAAAGEHSTEKTQIERLTLDETVYPKALLQGSDKMKRERGEIPRLPPQL